MEIDIRHADIGSRLCQRCGACCRVHLNLNNTDTRYRAFLRTLGFTLDPPAQAGQADCCEKRHNVRLDMGWCKHLEIGERDGHPHYRCRLYGKVEYPRLCADFDCVSWALQADTYNGRNRTLAAAQRALNRLRDEA